MGAQVDMNEAGHAIIAWYQLSGASNDIWANCYVPGSGWAGALQIEAASGEAMGPQVAMNDEGYAIVVWYQYDDARNSIWSNSCFAGLAWNKPQLVYKGIMGDAVDPHLAIDGMNNCYMVWQESKINQLAIWTCFGRL